MSERSGYLEGVSEHLGINVFYGLIMVWSISLVYSALDWSYVDRLFPIPSATLLAGLSAIALLRNHLRHLLPVQLNRLLAHFDHESEGSIQSFFMTDVTLSNPVIVTILSIIAFPIIGFYLGLLPMAVGFVVVFEYYLTRNIRKSLLATLGFALIVYGILILILDATFWAGVIFR